MFSKPGPDDIAAHKEGKATVTEKCDAYEIPKGQKGVPERLRVANVTTRAEEYSC